MDYFIFSHFIPFVIFAIHLFSLKKFPLFEFLSVIGIFATIHIKFMPYDSIFNVHPITLIASFLGFVGFLCFLFDMISRRIWKPYFIIYILYLVHIIALFVFSCIHN